MSNEIHSTNYRCYLDKEEKQKKDACTKKSQNVKKKQHTDWLSLQEVNVVKHLPLFGSQIVQPVFYDALTLLKKIIVRGRRKD